MKRGSGKGEVGVSQVETGFKSVVDGVTGKKKEGGCVGRPY